MKITETRVYLVGKGSLVANVSVTLDDEFAVMVAVREGKKGENFVTFPNHSYKDADGNIVYKDDFFPITKKARAEFIDTVLEAVIAEEKNLVNKKRYR